MIPWMKSLLLDKQAFFGVGRGALLGLGGIALTGEVEMLPKWLGIASLVAGGFLRSTGHARANGTNTNTLEG